MKRNQLWIALCIPIYFFCINNIRMSLGGIDTTEYYSMHLDIDDKPALLRLRPKSSSSWYDVDIQLMKDRLHESQSNETQALLRNHSFPHFLLHIPKTGGYNAQRKISTTLSNEAKFNALSPHDKFRLCNIGDAPILPHTVLMQSYGGTRCNMWMTEFKYNRLPSNHNMPEHTYTIIRNPKHQIISQYFHCVESNDRGRKEKREKKDAVDMPTLDSWLTQYVLAMNDTAQQNEIGKFRCYNPINLQSTYAGFERRKRTYRKDDADSGDASVSDRMRKDLQQKYTVIGPLDQMDKVLCLILIHYAGFLPDACNCSSDGSGSTQQTQAGQQSQNRRRRLDGNHGVSTHGSTYNTTHFQETLIEKLIAKDQVLYHYTKKLFDEQLRVVEEYFNVTICNTIKQ